ncbi:MAG: zinc protease [Actinomycetota bacterium]|jgi:predicted Zn-dependent peptidase
MTGCGASADNLRPMFSLERMRLENGLRVVLAPDRHATAVAVAVYYDVGFRSEPEGRSGFAHLFEHLMFEGSATLEKMEHARLVQGNGGTFNGSTNSDYTRYFETLPSNALELGLFLESDRMRSVRLSEETLENQIAVVKEEIRVNVLNRPYGGFPWIPLPQVMFRTFNNAHNGYGSFEDLEAATVDAAADFFQQYYAPGNAVLAVVGDFDVDPTAALVEKHFASIPAGVVPRLPDLSEPRPSSERRVEMVDALAPRPALAIGYRVPDPIQDLDEYLAVVVLASLLAGGGEASRLYQRLVKVDRTVSHMSGYVGTFGNPFEVRDPTMLQIVAYLQTDDVDEVLRAVDAEVEALVDDLLPDEVERVTQAMRSSYLADVDEFTERAMFLAVLEQQRSSPELLNTLPDKAAAVSPSAVRRAAERWLLPDKRAVLELQPGGTP